MILSWRENELSFGYTEFEVVWPIQWEVGYSEVHMEGWGWRERFENYQYLGVEQSLGSEYDS